jgi:hypothetical protein
MLADILICEIDKAKADVAPIHQPLLEKARDLASKYKKQQEVLASITLMYVETCQELDDLKARRCR